MFALAGEAEIRILGALSLKDKRSVIRSIMDRLRLRFGMCVIESGDQDLWQRGRIGFAYCVLAERDLAAKLDRIVREMEQDPGIEILSVNSDTVQL
ncbi:MAG: DUF503 domain-containing protein [Clostridia bacterium]|nr:DUF503 domain-containing protein [Clostridia bacterium]